MTSTDPLVLILADDLTGAGDTGMKFADAGWSTFLLRGEAPSPPAGPSPGRSAPAPCPGRTPPTSPRPPSPSSPASRTAGST
ncbi:hypothetical protein [Propioniciclava coleopterorum]|uniref:hypothetical protein n=1 Tax=Propioniciclava coleopterorum TaxID=2714937 RepID=UPI00198042CD|nr:hypothetical protein [Propioniciclava coleopterorum]